MFLRTLEYYREIMIFTINRVKNIDDAIQSRIFVTLHYELLRLNTRKMIWESFLKKTMTIKNQVEYTFIDLDWLFKKEVNDRQICCWINMCDAALTDSQYTNIISWWFETECVHVWLFLWDESIVSRSRSTRESNTTSFHVSILQSLNISSQTRIQKLSSEREKSVLNVEMMNFKTASWSSLSRKEKQFLWWFMWLSKNILSLNQMSWRYESFFRFFVANFASHSSNQSSLLAR